MLSLLTAARSPDASPRIESTDATLDEEWRWLSAYDAWRTARFTFLHPENLLLPELRRRDRQSPAFQALVQKLSGRVTADAATVYGDAR
jgi:hypothetical protein